MTAAARGYQNLSATTLDDNDALELVTKAEELELRRGDREGARYPRGNRAGRLFSLGRWDEALPLIDSFIAECESGNPHIHEAMLRRIRAWIRLARDDVEGALIDIERALAAARAAKDPQMLLPTLGDAIHIYTKLGRIEDATQLGREFVAAHPHAAIWSPDFMVVAGTTRVRPCHAGRPRYPA